MRIGVDIGGTKTDAVVVDGSGTVVQQLRLSTGYGAEAVLQTAVEAVTRVAQLAGLAVSDAESIGIGIPGRVDSAAGSVAHAVNLGVDGLDLGSELSTRLGVAVWIENDVNAAALGAYHRLEADGWPGTHDHSMAYLNLGTGLAAGIVIAGQLWRGSRGTAGEIGHIPVDPAGPLCPCGQRGCLELMASGSAIARQWPTDHAQPAQQLFDAADAGDGHIDVTVPAGVRVTARTLNGDVTITGTGADVSAHAQNGDLHIENASGHIDFSTLSGDIVASNLTGTVTANSISGDVTLTSVTGNVSLTSVSGGLTLRRITSQAVDAQTTSGDVTFDGGIDPAGRYAFTTHAGDISLDIPAHASAQLTVSTWSGSIDSDFPITLQPGEHDIGVATSKRFTFTIGGGAARIRAQSFNGDIVIHQRVNK